MSSYYQKEKSRKIAAACSERMRRRTDNRLTENLCNKKCTVTVTRVVFQGFAIRKISPAARPAANRPSPRAGGGIKAGLQANGKLFQIRRVFVQAFPNKALAVLRYFKGLQGHQTQRVRFQIFSRCPPFSHHIRAAAAPHPSSPAAWLRALGQRCRGE